MIWKRFTRYAVRGDVGFWEGFGFGPSHSWKL